MKLERITTAEVTKGEEERTLNFIASDSSVDRVDDIVEARGWELENFRQNGVFLWGHDSSIPALGAPTFAQVEGDQLKVGIRFAKAGTHELADLVHGLFDQKILRTVSVGFDAKEWEPIEGSVGTRFTRQELLELSAVNIPANRNAVIENAYKGCFDEIQRKGLEQIGLLPRELITIGWPASETRTIVDVMRDNGASEEEVAELLDDCAETESEYRSAKAEIEKSISLESISDMIAKATEKIQGAKGDTSTPDATDGDPTADAEPQGKSDEADAGTADIEPDAVKDAITNYLKGDS